MVQKVTTYQKTHVPVRQSNYMSSSQSEGFVPARQLLVLLKTSYSEAETAHTNAVCGSLEGVIDEMMSVTNDLVRSAQS